MGTNEPRGSEERLQNDINEMTGKPPVGGTIEDWNIRDPRGDEERLQGDLDGMTEKPPVGEIRLAWHIRLKEVVKKIMTAILAGISEAKEAAPKETKSHKILDVLYKILTIAAGIFGLKKL